MSLDLQNFRILNYKWYYWSDNSEAPEPSLLSDHN